MIQHCAEESWSEEKILDDPFHFSLIIMHNFRWAADSRWEGEAPTDTIITQNKVQKNESLLEV